MQEQLTLDWCQAHINRDNGIRVSLLNAESHNDKWAEEAFNWLTKYLGVNEGEFQAEQVRVFAEKNGLENPPSQRAWGSVILKAARMRLIRKVGLRATSSPTAHRCFAVVWIKK